MGGQCNFSSAHRSLYLGFGCCCCIVCRVRSEHLCRSAIYFSDSVRIFSVFFFSYMFTGDILAEWLRAHTPAKSIKKEATLSVLPHFCCVPSSFSLLCSFAIKFTRPTKPVSTNKAIKIKCQPNKSVENLKKKTKTEKQKKYRRII